MRIHLVTCSDRDDLELCRLLCRTIDEFVPPGIPHSIVVPSRDYRLFRPMGTLRRQIRIAEEVLGFGFRQLPRGHRVWQFRTAQVDGWYVQQLVKLATPAFVHEDVILHLDSDTWFVRPLEESRLMHGDRVRLYRWPGIAPPNDDHLKWHRTAALLLGREPTDYFGADFIAPAATWRTATVLALHEHLQRQFGVPWQEVLATREDWSEYTIYGIFVSVLGADRDHHFMDPGNFCLSFWNTNAREGSDRDVELEMFLQGLRVHHLAVLVQSTVPLTGHERERLYRMSTVRARSPRRGWLMQRIADRARSEPPEFWGPWVALGVRYLDHCSGLPANVGMLGRLSGLPSFLRREWGSVPVWRVPAVAISKYRRRTRRAF